MKVLTPVFSPMRRRSSCVRPPPASASSCRPRRASAAPCTPRRSFDLDAGRVQQPRGQARLQRARELGPQVGDDSRTRRIAIGDSRFGSSRPSWRAISSMHVVDQLEEVDAVVRALDQLLDLAGRGGRAAAPAARAAPGRRASACLKTTTPAAAAGALPGPAGPRVGRPRWGYRRPSLRHLAAASGPRPGGGVRPGCVGGGGRRAAGRRRRRRGHVRTGVGAGCGGRRRGVGGLRARSRERRGDHESESKTTRTHSPPGIGRRADRREAVRQRGVRSALGVFCWSSKARVPCRTCIRTRTRGSSGRRVAELHARRRVHAVGAPGPAGEVRAIDCVVDVKSRRCELMSENPASRNGVKS